jgi:hypothetical protein
VKQIIVMRLQRVDAILATSASRDKQAYLEDTSVKDRFALEELVLSLHENLVR